MSQVRILLHYLTGRDRNLLSHQLQEKVTEHLGYRRATTRSAVESLMKEYFLHARVIYGTCRKLLGAQGRGRVNQLTARKLVPGASMADILSVFEKSIDGQRPLSEKLGAKIVQARSHALEGLSYPKLSSQVSSLFRVRPGLYRTLNDMYELGVLEILFPEFGSTKARVIRDFYHKYTVDEHSLQAIKAIEELAEPESTDDERFQSLLAEVPGTQILSLTLLLHDVGKGRGGKHVDTGARMAARALRRYRFDKELINTVVFLIANHLAMSSIIFRRNLGDPEVISRFSDLVGDVDHLRLLCLVTYADIKGVAPGALNAWKKERLWQLYVEAYNKLTLGFGEERIEEEDIGERLVAKLPKDLDRNGFESFLEGFPLRYLTTTPPAEIYAHYRLGRKFLPSRSAQVRLAKKSSYYELCVVTADTSHLFSRIAGVVSYFGMNILRGYGFSNRQKIILDFFQFEDPQSVFLLNPQERSRLRELLLEVISDNISVEELLRGKEESLMFQSAAPGFRPLISFGEGRQTDYSIMEIVAPDSVGLLYRISREISESGCNIELVLISTEGDRAVDVFYLTHNGARLGVEIREELVKRITKALG